MAGKPAAAAVDDLSPREERFMLHQRVAAVANSLAGMSYYAAQMDHYLRCAGGDTSRMAIHSGTVRSLQALISGCLGPALGSLSDTVGRRPLIGLWTFSVWTARARDLSGKSWRPSYRMFAVPFGQIALNQGCPAGQWLLRPLALMSTATLRGRLIAEVGCAALGAGGPAASSAAYADLFGDRPGTNTAMHSKVAMWQQVGRRRATASFLAIVPMRPGLSSV
jgi:hypothetical protein